MERRAAQCPNAVVADSFEANQRPDSRLHPDECPHPTGQALPSGGNVPGNSISGGVKPVRV
jgi:hypothetical protein